LASFGDNTATDILVDLVGKNYLEKNTDPRNRLFLSTVDAFNLKHATNTETQKDYISGNIKTRREILKDFKWIQASARQLTESTPTLIEEIEWFFSTKELSDIIYGLRNAGDLYQLRPGSKT